MGTRTPCFTRAWILFWVTTRGRDRTFSKPRDSAMESTASIRTVLLAFRNVKPLVGEVEARLEHKGIVVPGFEAVLGTGMYAGDREPAVVGERPAVEFPPMALWPSPQPKPSCVPMSPANCRVAATTRAG